MTGIETNYNTSPNWNTDNNTNTDSESYNPDDFKGHMKSAIFNFGETIDSFIQRTLKTDPNASEAHRAEHESLKQNFLSINELNGSGVPSSGTELLLPVMKKADERADDRQVIILDGQLSFLENTTPAGGASTGGAGRLGELDTIETLSPKPLDIPEREINFESLAQVTPEEKTTKPSKPSYKNNVEVLALDDSYDITGKVALGKSGETSFSVSRDVFIEDENIGGSEDNDVIKSTSLNASTKINDNISITNKVFDADINDNLTFRGGLSSATFKKNDFTASLTARHHTLEVDGNPEIGKRTQFDQKVVYAPQDDTSFYAQLRQRINHGGNNRLQIGGGLAHSFGGTSIASNSLTRLNEFGNVDSRSDIHFTQDIGEDITLGASGAYRYTKPQTEAFETANAPVQHYLNSQFNDYGFSLDYKLDRKDETTPLADIGLKYVRMDLLDGTVLNSPTIYANYHLNDQTTISYKRNGVNNNNLAIPGDAGVISTNQISISHKFGN